MTPNNHFARLDPKLKTAIRSAVNTVQWSKKPLDVWVDSKRIHVYPIDRFENRTAWAVVGAGWELCAAGVYPDNTEEENDAA